MESRQRADLKASEAAVASAWCGGMLRMPVTALMISSYMAHPHLSISPLAGQDTLLWSTLRLGAGAVSAHAHPSERAAVLRSTFVALAWAAFSPAASKISWTAPLASTLFPTTCRASKL